MLGNRIWAVIFMPNYNSIIQVGVQVLRLLTTWHYSHLSATVLLLTAGCSATDHYLLLAGPTAANLQQQQPDGTDRQTDGRPTVAWLLS